MSVLLTLGSTCLGYVNSCLHLFFFLLILDCGSFLYMFFLLVARQNSGFFFLLTIDVMVAVCFTEKAN